MIRIFGVAHLSYHFTWAPPFVQIWLDLQNAQLEFIQQMSLSSLLHPDQRQINSTDFESLARIRPALRFHIQPKLNFSCIFRSNYIDSEISSDICISIDLHKMNKSSNPSKVHQSQDEKRCPRKISASLHHMQRSPQTSSIVDILLGRWMAPKLPTVVYSCK